MLTPGASTEEAVSLVDLADRRQWERYPCQWVASWPSATAEDSPSAEGRWTAAVQDYSVAGIALLGQQPLAVGSRLVVDIHDRERGVSQPLRVEIVRCVEQPDGQWLIGCAILDED